MKPVKRTKEYTDKFAESITMTTPQGDNTEAGINCTASLTTIEEETQDLQTQAGSTDEVWQNQRNQKRQRGFNNDEPTTMTTSQGVIDRRTKAGHRLTGIEEETHQPLVQAKSTDEVWQRQGNPKSRWGFSGERPTIVTTNKEVLGTSAKSGCSPIFGVQVGTDTYALRTEPGTVHTPPKTYKKPKSGSQHKSSYKGRHPSFFTSIHTEPP